MGGSEPPDSSNFKQNNRAQKRLPCHEIRVRKFKVEFVLGLQGTDRE